jgi:hypothetical protein
MLPSKYKGRFRDIIRFENQQTRDQRQVDWHFEITRQVKHFDNAWKTACKEAKIGVRLFHDLPGHDPPGKSSIITP